MATDTMGATFLRVFYPVLLLTVLFGNVTGILEQQNFPAPPDLVMLGMAIPMRVFTAIVIASIIELMATAVMLHVAERRRKGEMAVPSYILSTMFACGAAWWNLASHAAHLWGALWMVLSSAGYIFFVMRTEASRRDRRRAEGQLAGVSRSFTAKQWILNGPVTLAASRLALTDPDMTVDQAFALAHRQRRVAGQRKRLGPLLISQLESKVGPERAKAMIELYDVGKIVEALQAGADNAAVAAALLDQMSVEVVAAGMGGRTVRRTPNRPETHPPVRTTGQRALTGEVLPAIRPSVEEMAQILGQHHDGRIGVQKAARTLREEYGRMSVDRATPAKDLHNEWIGQATNSPDSKIGQHRTAD